MANQEKIAYLLEEVKKLEELLNGVLDAEIYPVSFFSKSFDLTREVLKELYQLEAQQVEILCKQMKARQAILRESLLQTSVGNQDVPEHEQPEPEIQPEEKPVPTEKEEDLSEITSIEESAGLPPVKDEKSIEELLKEFAPPQPLIPEKEIVPLQEVTDKKNLPDFRKAFSLNDRFYFLRELFEGNDTRMNETIDELNEIQSLEESLDYINNKMRWNPEDTAVADFICLVEKRFS